MITINDSFEFKVIKFPAGENQVTVKIKFDKFFKDPHIVCNWESSEDTEILILLKDALDRIGHGKYAKLEIPYMPYSRQDRVTEEGASFALKCFADIINSLNFKEVITLDAHSQATELLFNNLTNVDQSEFLRSILENEEQIDCIIAPDAGAYKKVYETCSKLPDKIKKRITVVCAQKVRNVRNGEIIGMEIDPFKLDGKECLVLDDICDGGRTFIELAKGIEKCSNGLPICAPEFENIQLAVTHGIFSKGRKELEKYYSKIHILNNMEKKDVSTV
jgi:ribose-phosphate pyrophosphokinase